MNTATQIRNPFPGLRPFRTEESTLFFGRDEQIGEALDRMLRQKLLAIVGVSGCGKSSLVSAGMVPALEMGLAGDPEQRWRVASMRPGDGPLRELARCLGFDGALAERTYGLTEAVESHLPPGENLLLVVDQFEEIFPFRDRKLRTGAGSEADLFVSYVLRAAQDPNGRIYTLLTMRSDYLGECAKFHGLPEALNDGQYLVPRMTRQQLQEAMEGPLEAVKVTMHPALVQELLNQCDEEPDNLPLLQHLLRRMFEEWETAGSRGAITSAIGKSVGGLAGALDKDAEQVCAGLSAEELRISEVLFRRITESRRQAEREEDDRPVRRPQTIPHLASLAAVEEAAVLNVARRFESRGLLVVRQTDQGDKADLPHECLCLRWTRLKEWIRRESEDAKKLRFLSDATERKALLAGLALDEALQWQRDGRFTSPWCSRYFNQSQIEAVTAWVAESERITEASREAERRREEERRVLAEDERRRELEREQAERRSRRTRTAAGLLGLMAVTFALLGVIAFRQRQRANGLAREALLEKDRANAQTTLAASETRRANEKEQFALQSLNAAISSGKEATAAMALAQASEKEARERADLYFASQFAAYSNAAFREPAGVETAVLLAITAARRRELPEVDIALRQSVQLLRAVRNSWDLSDGTLLQRRPDPVRPGRSIVDDKRRAAFNADGCWIVIDGRHKGVRVMDALTGKEVRRLFAEPAGEPVAFSPDGKFVAANIGEELLLVEVATGKETARLPLPRAWRAVALSSDGRRIAVDGDGALRVIEAGTAKEVWSFQHPGELAAATFSPNGELLALSEQRVPTGSRPVAANEDQAVTLLNVVTGEIVTRLEHGKLARVLAFSPDGKRLITGSADNLARVFDTSRWSETLRLAHQSEVLAVAFSRDGKWVATGSADGTARVMDVASGTERARLPHKAPVRAVAFSADTKLLRTWADNRMLVTWDAPTASSEVPLGNTAEANSLAFSPDGRSVVTGSVDNKTRVLDVATWKENRSVIYPAEILAVAFTPDGKFVTSKTRKGIARMEVATGRDVAAGADEREVYSLAWSPDGTMLAEGGADSVWLQDAKGRMHAKFEQGAGVYGLAWSPDGKLMLTGDSNNIARLWDVASRRQEWNLTLAGRVYASTFRRDGKWVAAGGGAAVKVRETASGRELYRIDLPLGAIVAGVRISDDGRWLETIHQVSETDKNLVYSRHSLDMQQLIREGCSKLTRNLSDSEWDQYAKGMPYVRACEHLADGRRGN